MPWTKSNTATFWTANPEAEALLEQLVKNGRTASEVAALISERYGHKLTRNAILGKAMRLGLRFSPTNNRWSSGGMQTGSRVVSVRDKRSEAKRVEYTKPEPFVWMAKHDDFISRLKQKMHNRRRPFTPAQIRHFIETAFGSAPTMAELIEHLAALEVKADDMATTRFTGCDLKPEEGGVPVIEHDFYTCHWPMAAYGEKQRLCGKKLFHGSYCCDHAMRAYNTLLSDPKPLGGIKEAA